MGGSDFSIVARSVPDFRCCGANEFVPYRTIDRDVGGLLMGQFSRCGVLEPTIKGPEGFPRRSLVIKANREFHEFTILRQIPSGPLNDRSASTFRLASRLQPAASHPRHGQVGVPVARIARRRVDGLRVPRSVRAAMKG